MDISKVLREVEGEIEKLQRIAAALRGIGGRSSVRTASGPRRRRGRLSAAARARIAAAQRARWAKIRAKK